MTHAEHTAAIIEAFNAADWDRSRELTAGAVYFEPATGRTLEGDAYLEALRGWKAAFSDVTGEIVGQVQNGDVAVLEIVWTGTHDGPFVTPGGELAPTGNALTNPATMVAHFEGDRLVRVNHYFDMLTVLRGVGAA